MLVKLCHVWSDIAVPCRQHMYEKMHWMDFYRMLVVRVQPWPPLLYWDNFKVWNYHLVLHFVHLIMLVAGLGCASLGDVVRAQPWPVVRSQPTTLWSSSSRVQYVFTLYTYCSKIPVEFVTFGDLYILLSVIHVRYLWNIFVAFEWGKLLFFSP